MSLIQMHRSPNRFAAWLAVVAILLLFIAPVISKSLVSDAARDSMMMPGMAMEHDMAMDDDMPMDGMNMATMSPLEHARMMQHHPMSMMDDSACGYCVLLAHLPLDLTNFPVLWTSLQAARLPDSPPFRPAVARFIPQFFHPRAPPAY
ncbi:DUF2946 domain-containing protein [Erwinia billingiae]|uniref:DUF2946 domain-containing protein n=1 Tax=Erwinia billingiae TaxID=182337 RepID=UPI0030D00B58